MLEKILGQIDLLEDITADFAHTEHVPREYLLRILAAKQVQIAKISGVLESLNEGEMSE